MEVKLNSDEVTVLREVLKRIKIKKRTSELGIIHGMDRFVSTHCSLKKNCLESLDEVARKIGIASGIERVEK